MAMPFVSMNQAATRDSIILHRTRIQDSTGGYRGTVHYIGTVVTSKSPDTLYVGVAWDDVGRGKHNGSVVDATTNSLVSYFDAGHPTAGSFLKLSKIDTGVPLTESVVFERYVALESEECVAPNEKLPHYMPTSKGRPGKVVEFLGEFKIRQYQQVDRLQQLSLRLQGLSSIAISPPEWVSLQHIQSLDLAGNLFCSWEDVLPVLLTNLPLLHELSLAANRLNDVKDDGNERLFPLHEHLKHLNIHTTNIQSIHTVSSILRAVPNLQELILAHNSLKGRGDVLRNSERLVYLDVSDCNLDESFVLESLPSQLETLRMDDNPQVTTLPSHLTCLHDLQISNTGFTDWPPLPDTVCRLRMCDVPFSLDRLAIVAHYPMVVHLNGSAVTSDQRKQAARWAVRNAVSTVTYWKEQYPELATATMTSSQPSVQHRVINVTIVSLAAASCTLPPLQRRLPVSLAIEDVKKLCIRQFGIQRPILQWSTDDSSLPEMITDMSEVSDGATVWVNDEVDELDHKSSSVEELHRRIDRQEQERNAFLKLQESLKGA